MEQKPAAPDWYAKNSSGDQGIVIDANTGRNVAVAYEARDTAILAAAPEMFAALVECEQLLHKIACIYGGTTGPRGCDTLSARRAARAAIAKATGE